MILLRYIYLYFFLNKLSRISHVTFSRHYFLFVHKRMIAFQKRIIRKHILNPFYWAQVPQYNIVRDNISTSHGRRQLPNNEQTYIQTNHRTTSFQLLDWAPSGLAQGTSKCNLSVQHRAQAGASCHPVCHKSTGKCGLPVEVQVTLSFFTSW